MALRRGSWAVRVTIATIALGAGACSLLAPSAADLSSAYVEDAGADVPSPVDPRCPPGTKACAGACVSVGQPATGCGAVACEPCRAGHAEAICVGGACAIGPCENGWANCNGRADDGCEVDTRESAQFCGSCVLSCGFETPRCEQGECVPRCQAIKLTSAAAHVSIPTAGMGFGRGDFTVEVWLKRHAEFTSNGHSLFTSNEVSLVSAIVLRDDGGTLRFDVTRSTPSQEIGLEGSLPADQRWHHVAGVRRGGVATLYVDGAVVAQAANTNEVVVGSAAALGRPAGYPSFEASAMVIGPLRVSRTARYVRAFSPRTYWPVDADTVAQFLTSRAFDGIQLVDEAFGDNDGVFDTGVISSPDTPCP